jgi:hypothetical protein
MPFIDELPEPVADLIRSGAFSEFATLSGAGVPIDTPTYYFPSEDLATLDITTGLAYPAKAERARRIPRVGLLIEGGPNEPVISIAGLAAVRDADIQANLDRYVAETASLLPPGGTWEAMRRATFYWARIFVCVTPAHIRWWPNRAALQTDQPSSWRAPSGTIYPSSDPAPAAKASAAPEWPKYRWQELAAAALDRKETGYLTLCDSEGFPIPLRVRDVEQTDEGFRVTAPQCAPWSEGSATLSFFGREIFVCQARREGKRTVLRVERPLPVSPITPAGGNVPRPDRETRAILTDRMNQELLRRSQPTPAVPLDPLPPTTGARLRMQAFANSQGKADC